MQFEAHFVGIVSHKQDFQTTKHVNNHFSSSHEDAHISLAA